MNAIILSIGDELTLGQTIDTNSAWLSQQLAAVGCSILAHMTVPDDQKEIEQAINESAVRCNFLVISGGIGPTEDDLTRQALAGVLHKELEPDQKWLAHLIEFFKARGREMPQTNRIQAMVPRGAVGIDNKNGTALGIKGWIRKHGSEWEWGPGDAPLAHYHTIHSCFVAVMPGVPKEMKAMFLDDVLPIIRNLTGGAVILSRTLHTFGLGESWIAERLGDLMKRDRNPSVGTTVSNGIVSLRINARFASRDEAQSQLDQTIRSCESALGDIIFGADDQTLPQVVTQLLNRKSQIENRKSTLTTAESCTGGLLAKLLTDIPGSSDFFKTGFVTYSNESKIALLGVNPATLDQHGAVSEPTAREMATGALNRAKSDFALSITGIAGPAGGTAAKPVGTVCIALAAATAAGPTVTARTFNFPGDREMIRDRSAKMALSMLRYHLLAREMPF